MNIVAFLSKNRFFAATTGDTGSAALEAFKDLPFIDIVVLLPKGWCTKVQELQMTTVGGSNTHVLRGKSLFEKNTLKCFQIILRACMCCIWLTIIRLFLKKMKIDTYAAFIAVK